MNLAVGDGLMGQRYGHPRDVLAGSDAIIVGSGIHKAEDPVAAAKAYADASGMPCSSGAESDGRRGPHRLAVGGAVHCGHRVDGRAAARRDRALDARLAVGDMSLFDDANLDIEEVVRTGGFHDSTRAPDGTRATAALQTTIMPVW